MTVNSYSFWGLGRIWHYLLENLKSRTLRKSAIAVVYPPDGLVSPADGFAPCDEGVGCSVICSGDAQTAGRLAQRAEPTRAGRWR